MFVIKYLQQRFIAPRIYTISEYVSKSRQTNRKDKGTCKCRNRTVEEHRSQDGIDRSGQESQGDRGRTLHRLQGFCKPDREEKTVGKEFKVAIHKRIALTIFYLDFLDSHPHYGLTMLKELWT